MIATRCRFSSVLTAVGIYATIDDVAETDLGGLGSHRLLGSSGAPANRHGSGKPEPDSPG
jgi:hypothetical protein